LRKFRAKKGVGIAYETLYEKLKFDTVLLIDGGSDSLMAGNEFGIATVQEDFTSMPSVLDAKLPLVKKDKRMLAVIGVGVDRYHGVSDASSLRAIAEIQQKGGFLGAQQLHAGQKCTDEFIKAVAWCQERTHTPSIVGLSICSAMKGSYGNVHSSSRTKGSKLWINPLMATLFVFDLETCVNRIMPVFQKAFRDCETINETFDAVERVREKLKQKKKILPQENYPMHDEIYPDQNKF